MQAALAKGRGAVDAAFRDVSHLSSLQRYMQRFSALRSERASWLTLWQDVQSHFLPRRLILEGESYAARGRKKHEKIINGAGTKASRILSAGMQSGITSPSRPWFRLEPPDMRIRNSASVRAWLDQVEDLMRVAIARSNLYNCFHNVYGDLGTVGTSALHINEDEEDGIRGYLLPVGQYCLAIGARENVTTCFRETQFTVEQLVERFGYQRLHPDTQEKYRLGQLDARVPVLNVIEPNRHWDGERMDGGNKAFSGVWMEMRGEDKQYDRFLDVEGFYEFPVLAPRWNVTDAVYGDSPAMDALGDVRALQHLEREKAKAFAKVVSPPMVGPTSLQAHKASLLPGDYTAVDSTNGGQTYRPAMEINAHALAEYRADIAERERHVNELMYANTWLIISQAEKNNMTATEVAQRSEEKMLQLGPVLERLQDEFLDPCIDRVFSILWRRGMLPPPPQELQGAPLRVEYTSMMAQAQRAIGITAIDRLAAFGRSLIEVSPGIRHKFNFNRMADEYASSLGTKSELLRTDEEADALAAQEQEAINAQAQGEAALAATQGAKALSETNKGSDSALTRLLSGMGAPVNDLGAQ